MLCVCCVCVCVLCCCVFFFQAEDGIRDLVRSRGLGDVYKRQISSGRFRSSGDSKPKVPFWFNHGEHYAGMAARVTGGRYVVT